MHRIRTLAPSVCLGNLYLRWRTVGLGIDRHYVTGVTQGSAVQPPEPVKAAPALPEPVKAAPAPPEPVKAAPAPPEPVKSANSDLKDGLRVHVRGERRGNFDRKERRHFHKEGSMDDKGLQRKGSNYSQGKKVHGRVGGGNTKSALSLSDVAEDLEDIKIVFSSSPPGMSRQSFKQQKTEYAAANQSHLIPRAPLPPEPPTAPPAPSTTCHVGGDKPAVPHGVTKKACDGMLGTIAPPSGDNIEREVEWVKSSMSSLDDEIEHARATRPLVRSHASAQDVERPTLSVGPLEMVDDVILGSIDKECLRTLPKEEALMVDNHEIPHDLSEKKAITSHVEANEFGSDNIVPLQHPANADMESGTSHGADGGSSDPIAADGSQQGSVSAASTVVKAVAERMPLAPWANEAFEPDKAPLSLKILFDETSPHMVTIKLQEPLRSTLGAVQALNGAITEIEDRYASAGGPVMHVVLTSLPGLDFFRPMQSPLELSCAERVELLRAKEQLFCRMNNTVPLVFVALVHGGLLDNFSAELFFACHYRVLLDAGNTALDFSSVTVGDFPSSYTVRQLIRYFGLQCSIDTCLQRCGIVAQALLNTGVAWSCRNLHEAASLLPPAYVDHSKASMPTFSLMRWLERTLLALLPRPSQRNYVLRKFFLASAVDKGSGSCFNPTACAWTRYCLASAAQGSRNNSDPAGSTITERLSTHGFQSSEKVFADFVYSQCALNAASVYRRRCEIQRRVLSTPPTGGYLIFSARETELWPLKVKALLSNRCDKQTVVLECAEQCIDAMERLVKDHHDTLAKSNVVLMGDEHISRPLIAEFPCVITTSSASSYTFSTLGDLQEVRVFAHEDCDVELCTEALSAALAYLQRVQRPYVVCHRSCYKRLIAAFVTEACRLALQCSIERIDRVSTEVLGLLEGPFRLTDNLGAAAVLRMIEDTRQMNEHQNPLVYDRLPSIGYRALRGMNEDGFGGVRTRRGGFYIYDENGTPVGFNREVERCYLQRQLTDTELSERLLFIVVNECCELLLAGHVRAADDANMLTIASLGFSESTGGALALADAMGADLLLRKMEDTAEWHGSHLAPSPLLKCMANSRVSFASLSGAIIQSARM